MATTLHIRNFARVVFSAGAILAIASSALAQEQQSFDPAQLGMDPDATESVQPAEVSAEPFDGVPGAVPGGVIEAILFYIFGGTLLISAVAVCVCKSIVRMATWLFFTLGCAAVLYLLLGAAFVGAVQLIVYAGGTLILLVFGVMLTSKSPWVRFETPRIEMLAAGGVAVVLFLGLVTVITTAVWPRQADFGPGVKVAEFGKELLTTYLVPFEVASVLLLVVMIAAAYLARQDQSSER